MAVWPFRRKNRRKRPRSDNMSDLDSTTRDTPEDLARARRRKTDPGSQTQPIPIKRQPNKLHRRERSYSFEKGREDALAIERRKTSRNRGSGAALHGPVDPRAHPYSKEFGTPNSRAPPPWVYDNFPRMPTLHNKRNAEHLSRKKSSKRMKADHAREEEIRAMSAFEPVRPAAEPWQSGRPMKRDTKKVRMGLGLSFRRSWEREEPNSDISLPLPGSIHSSLSSDSEQVSFKVSALEALAPRPTLRYTVHPRYGSPPRERPNRHVSVKNKLSEKGPIPEATLRAHKRVDDLADDLTASDLRELMERDERRRTRKREREQERIERRLARRAERDRAAEKEGQPSQPNMERGVVGRESVGLGIEPESTVVTSSKPRTSPRRSPSPTSKQQGKRPAAEMEDDDEAGDQAAQGPIGHFHRTDSIPLDNASMITEPEEPPNHRSSSPRKKIILMPRSSRSKSPPPPLKPAKPESSDTERKTSEGSIKKLRRSWSNLFRWGSRSRRKSGPSSFSNTSRDSMSGAHAPVAPAAPIPAALTRKLSSNVPKRTLSRFREDLPELPLSPPQSRESSPGPAPSAIMEQDSPELDTTMDLDDEPTPKRRDTPMSPTEAIGSVPASMPTSIDPSPEPVPVSLGSVDSEGSWFGKKTKTRRAMPMAAPLTPPPTKRQRAVSMSSDDSHHDPDLPTQMVEEDDDYDLPSQIVQDDASDLADDEYLARFANQRSSGSHMTNARPSSDASDDARWGIVGGRHPKVVEPQAGDFVKSREGLLNTFSEGAKGSEFGVDEMDMFAHDEDKENGLFRANSATRHKRGSARLMEITPRPSVDSRRVPAS